VLRHLAASGPVVVAVDDVQWLVASIFELLLFAARRLRDEPVLRVVRVLPPAIAQG